MKYYNKDKEMKNNRIKPNISYFVNPNCYIVKENDLLRDRDE